ncbi:MAG: hypothetical protein AAF383_12670 [Cyanobacteria bacterium P01_A01_bin.83]
MDYFTRENMILLELRILETKQQELLPRVKKCDLDAIEKTLAYSAEKIKLFKQLDKSSISDN